MDLLKKDLEVGRPIIAAVDTRALPYWDNENEANYHAVVIAGIDESTVSVSDPWFIEAPKVVENVQFESAWLYREYAMAVIEKSS